MVSEDFSVFESQPAPRSSSYCLDVVVGYSEPHREELIKFLRETGAPFHIGEVQRGMWQEAKILRIVTPNAQELQEHIYTGLRTGDDNDYVIHESEIEARRYMRFLPDLDTKHDNRPFSLTEAVT